MKGSDTKRPLIVRRPVEGGGHGHHGGGWKVAYADFVTAMMAFFLLLWLVGSADKDTLKGLAEFFSDARINTGPPGGAGGVLQGFTVVPAPPVLPAAMVELPIPMPLQPGGADAGGTDAALPDLTPRPATFDEAAALDAAEGEIVGALEAAPELRQLKDSLAIDLTPEGLRIQLLDRDQLAMFPIGSAEMYPHTRRLLQTVAATAAKTGHRLSIRGHADALPFAPGAGYDNWSLSADRADATRRALVESGLPPEQVAEIVGKGDSEPLVPENRADPRNRRISIVLLREGEGREASFPPFDLP